MNCLITHLLDIEMVSRHFTAYEKLRKNTGKAELSFLRKKIALM